MARYHVSEDGTPRVCQAQSPESCTARGVDGEPAPHGEFTDANEARRFAESVLEESAIGSGLSGVSRSVDYESSRKDKMDRASELNRPLPDLKAIYDEKPRVNIGTSMVYADLKGIQRDLDEKRISNLQGRQRIAKVAAKLRELEAHDETAQRPESIEFRKRVEDLSEGAEPAGTLADKPQWKSVVDSIAAYKKIAKYNSKEDFKLQQLAGNIQEHRSRATHDGFSTSRTLDFAKELEKASSKARKPELVALNAALRDAIGTES